MPTKLQADLQKSVQSFNKAYANGDATFFSHFADDASIYTEGATQPHAGREAYKNAFKKALAGEKRAVRVVEQEAQMLGDTAVVMQLLEVKISDITQNIRESTIWRRAPDGWQIVHLNASAVGPVISTASPRTAQAIRVLKEKIALVSSQAGVAQ